MMCMPRRNEPQKVGIQSFQLSMHDVGASLQKFTQGAANSRIWVPRCTRSAANSRIWGPHCTQGAANSRIWAARCAKSAANSQHLGVSFQILEFKGLFWQHFQRNPCLPLSWGQNVQICISFWSRSDLVLGADHQFNFFEPNTGNSAKGGDFEDR